MGYQVSFKIRSLHTNLMSKVNNKKHLEKKIFEKILVMIFFNFLFLKVRSPVRKASGFRTVGILKISTQIGHLFGMFLKKKTLSHVHCPCLDTLFLPFCGSFLQRHCCSQIYRLFLFTLFQLRRQN